MEEKRSSTAPPPPSDAAKSPASEPAASTRRRGGAQKRKSSALGSASNSSSATPSSKRVTREKPSSLHHQHLHTPPLHHNGPLTRARQIPATTATAASSSVTGGSASAPAVVKHSERGGLALGVDSVAAIAEEFRKESERQSLEASIEAEFEAIRSRGHDAHVVPTHCGWFSWMDIHPIEKRMMSSFFNGKTENRTPDIYMEIRNWIMKKFHANPNVQIELKDLSELNIGDLDAKQEVMEFLDYWGLINFHPFSSMGSALASAGGDEEAEKNALLQKLYQFESLQLCPPAVQKTSTMTPAMTTGLFPDSAIAEELVRQQEGPAVEMLEYHCNSCSADCSRKRYHCQKQADFDLCTDCFSNRKFGSGMSSSDFILMEPAEVAGVVGGKWTDQETLLLLEALELYKENWNEIAEHVGTKSKAQCILHFVQMPIEDAFVDRDDVVEASCKETAADPAATNDDTSAQKDNSECIENNNSVTVDNHGETSKSEDTKEKVNEETPRPENGSGEKNTEENSKSEDADKAKFSQEVGNNCALNALKEAFAAVGYSPGPEGPSSFADVGNPVMALAAFLARLVGSDVAFASAHSSLKSMSGNSPSTELAARNCFILDDQPDNKKEPTTSERDSKKEGDQDEINVKQDKQGDKDLPDDNSMKIDNNNIEDKRQVASTEGKDSEKPNASKEQAVVSHEECRLDNGNDPNNSKLPNDQATTTLPESGGSNSQTEIPPTSEEVQEGTSTKEPGHPVDETKDIHAPDSCPADKNDMQQADKSNSSGNNPQPVEATKNTEMLSDSMPSDTGKPKKGSVPESMQTKDSVMDVDMASSSLPSEKSESQSLGPSISAQQNGTENDVDMVSPSNAGDENGTDTGKEHTENDTKEKDDSIKTKHNDNIEKEKRAAVTTLAAAAVKAKLLADQEEEEIRQLTSSLIEKQLHKLETKLAFFNEMENLVMRVREHLERSRHKLFHERALIIASRLGLPASSSRGVPPSLPTNRIPMNFANSLPRSQNIMNPQRPPIPKPMGPIATTLTNPLASATAAGNSVQPSSQEKLSSVGTK